MTPPLRTPREETHVEIGEQHQSQLFTVRLWTEDLGDGRTEWRGKVQHVISGEAHYFREWTTLVAWLVAMLPPSETKPTTDEIQKGCDRS